MVQNSFFNFDEEGTPFWDLKGKDLIQGETDGSSYPSGGLRATHTAGGYPLVLWTAWATSQTWLQPEPGLAMTGLVSHSALPHSQNGCSQFCNDSLHFSLNRKLAAASL